MAHPDTCLIQKHSNDVESIALPGSPEAVNPDVGRSRQLSALSPADGFYWTTKVVGAPSFDFDKYDHVAALHYQIDIPVSIAKPATHHPPSLPLQPP